MTGQTSMVSEVYPDLHDVETGPGEFAPVDHDDAFCLSAMKRAESNTARCYLHVRQLLARVALTEEMLLAVPCPSVDALPKLMVARADALRELRTIGIEMLAADRRNSRHAL